MVDVDDLTTVVRLAHSAMCTTDATSSSVQHELNRVVVAVLAIDEVAATSLQVDVLNYRGRVMHTAAGGHAPPDIDCAATYVITKQATRGDTLTFRWSATVRDALVHCDGPPPDHRAEIAALDLIIDHLTPVITAVIDVLSIREATVNRDPLGTAKGMLMERHHIDADAAFALIKRLSQDSNTKAATIAHRVIAAGPNT